MSERQRFKVHAYIGFDGAVHQPRLEGWALPGDIWVSAPDDAGFAVVETGPLPEFLVWVWDVALGGYAFQKGPPESVFKAPTAEAAVMWAVHHAR